ncbi:thiamine phosphate synthase [Denitromonas iodatirespirans]|uniref:Thiamine-phosphate synthase n=1 Tax=Denitromonas iodatirespirans TaxID=2795389 RepID=A0A944D813_DENI1|nr:thiamine phosphate synthase [Denitromonas iodatirespirans]MBT0959728.1 thiamine phosphate synthase [Denitromonas iodatirespirans]
MTTRRPLPRGLYLVTPDWDDSARLMTAVEAALAGRPAMLQYRNKTADAPRRLAQALGLRAACRRAGVPFIVNDDLELALHVDADGVHLGRDDGALDAARERLGADRILGVTCYNELPRADMAVKLGADYVAFGAMYPSPTKPQAVAATPALLGAARARFGVSVAAIGGITADNAAPLIAAGADLLAVVSDVFMAADVTARAAAYRALFDATRPPQSP